MFSDINVTVLHRDRLAIKYCKNGKQHKHKINIFDNVSIQCKYEKQMDNL